MELRYSRYVTPNLTKWKITQCFITSSLAICALGINSMTSTAANFSFPTARACDRNPAPTWAIKVIRLWGSSKCQSISAFCFQSSEPAVRILLSYTLAAELSIIVLACGIAVLLAAFLSASLGSEQERPFFSQRSQSFGHVRLIGRHFVYIRIYYSLRD
jgi:hypothetical protein